MPHNFTLRLEYATSALNAPGRGRSGSRIHPGDSTEIVAHLSNALRLAPQAVLGDIPGSDHLGSTARRTRARRTPRVRPAGRPVDAQIRDIVFGWLTDDPDAKLRLPTPPPWLKTNIGFQSSKGKARDELGLPCGNPARTPGLWWSIVGPARDTTCLQLRTQLIRGVLVA
jgi:hypothetical protein